MYAPFDNAHRLWNDATFTTQQKSSVVTVRYTRRSVRLTQLRMNIALMTDIVQRQIYIDGLCISMFVPDPECGRHRDEMAIVRTGFAKLIPQARMIPLHGSLILMARDVHVLEVMSDHVNHYPTRYGDGPESASPEFANIVAGMVKGDTQFLAIQITREEVVAFDTSNPRKRLEELTLSNSGVGHERNAPRCALLLMALMKTNARFGTFPRHEGSFGSFSTNARSCSFLRIWSQRLFHYWRHAAVAMSRRMGDTSNLTRLTSDNF